MISKPLLAAKAPDLNRLAFPLWASPKLDGIRCIVQRGGALSRTFKPIPNLHIQQAIKDLVDHDPQRSWDGELLLTDWTAPFSDVTSAVMSRDGEPDFTLALFDYVPYSTSAEQPFEHRLELLRAHHALLPESVRWWCQIVPHYLVHDADELSALHTQFLAEGYEGTMLRSPDGPYKFGRSTVRQGTLLKLKNFVDEEAIIVGFEEQQHNNNPAERDEVGKTKRSSAKAGKTGAGTLGTMECVFTSDKTLFHCGAGALTADMRQHIWDNQRSYLNRTIKVRHQPPPGPEGRRLGEKPRIPTFVGFRDAIDC